MKCHSIRWLTFAALIAMLPRPALAQAPWTVDASTIAVIHFDEADGLTCFDASPNSNHATLSPGATRVSGRFSNGVYLDGVDDFIRIARSASLDPLPTPQMTLEFWIRLARSGRNGICNKALISGSSCWPWAFMTFNSSELYGLVRGCNGGVSGPVLPLDEWHQVSLVYDATGATPIGKLYVDGSLVGTNTNMETQTTNLAADVYIGALYHVSNPGNHLQDFFKGTIDEVRISNIARDPSTPPPPPNTPPSVSVLQPSSNLVHDPASGAVQFAGTASDPEGHLTRVEYRMDAGSWEIASGTENWSFQLPEAFPCRLYIIEVRAIDAESASSEVASRRIALLDRVPYPVAFDTNDFVYWPGDIDAAGELVAFSQDNVLPNGILKGGNPPGSGAPSPLPEPLIGDCLSAVWFDNTHPDGGNPEYTRGNVETKLDLLGSRPPFIETMKSGFVFQAWVFPDSCDAGHNVRRSIFNWSSECEAYASPCDASGAGQFSAIFRLDGNNTLVGGVNLSGTSIEPLVRSTGGVPWNKWSHVAMRYELLGSSTTARLTLYIDSTEVARLEYADDGATGCLRGINNTSGNFILGGAKNEPNPLLRSLCPSAPSWPEPACIGSTSPCDPTFAFELPFKGLITEARLSSGDAPLAYRPIPSGLSACLAWDISGQLTSSCGTSMAGVQVDLFSGDGSHLETVATAVGGSYLIPSVPAGDDYTLLVVTPLGYVGVEPATFDLHANATVNFTLQCIDVIDDARTIGFWKHNVGLALRGRTQGAQESGATLLAYADLIFHHFHANFVHPIDIEGVTFRMVNIDGIPTQVPLDLATMNATLDIKNASMLVRAKQQYLALLLNLASMRLATSTVVSVDGRTCSQAVTYVSDLIGDGDPSNDELAKNIADTINNSLMVAAGVIPPNTPDIAYKGETSTIPVRTQLIGAAPNPFNPSTVVYFDLHEETTVQIRVYDTRGRLIRELLQAKRPAGRHSVAWDGRNASGLLMSSGVYYMRFAAGNHETTKRAVLLK